EVPSIGIGICSRLVRPTRLFDGARREKSCPPRPSHAATCSRPALLRYSASAAVTALPGAALPATSSQCLAVSFVLGASPLVGQPVLLLVRRRVRVAQCLLVPDVGQGGTNVFFPCAGFAMLL
ncbi:unnamed protein product, partial [Prorocentrum cordatum]